MLDAGAHLRARRIGGVLRLTEFAIAIGPAMNAALQTALSELFLDLIAAIGAFRPHIRSRVARIKNIFELLTVVQALSRPALAGLDLWRLFSTMTKINYAGHRFPPEIIQQAIWLYLRFTLSFRDVEDLLAERGILVSYETVRRWVNHFGPKIAADLRKRRPKPHTIWHFDESAPRRREGGAMS